MAPNRQETQPTEDLERLLRPTMEREMRPRGITARRVTRAVATTAAGAAAVEFGRSLSGSPVREALHVKARTLMPMPMEAEPTATVTLLWIPEVVEVADAANLLGDW